MVKPQVIFSSTAVDSLRGGKIYLRLQIKFLTEVLGLIKRSASLEAAVEMKGRGVIWASFALFLNSLDFFSFLKAQSSIWLFQPLPQGPGVVPVTLG